jgi:hypothetical protein
MLSFLPVAFAQAPQAVEEIAPEWWNSLVSAWAAENQLTSYTVVLGITLKPDYTVDGVLILESSAPIELTKILVERVFAADPFPEGTPLAFHVASRVTVSRDDEIFGGSRDTEVFGNEPPPASRDEGVLGVNADETEASLAEALKEADNKLTVGGRLYLRLGAAVQEEASTDKDFWDQTSFSAPNLLDLFVDYRPDDHVRAFANGRIGYDYTIAKGSTDFLGNEQQPGSVDLDELWLKFDLASRVFFTAGMQHLRFGTGRFWNPTDFLNETPKDPLALFDLRTGVPLLKVHIPFERLGGNLYGVTDFTHTTDGLDYLGGAMRAEVAAGPGEYAVMAAARKDAPLRLGADLSMGVWLFDIRAEAAVLHGTGLSRWSGDFDIETLTFPEEEDLSEAWIPQAVVGLEIPIKYSSEDSINLGVEYFYNGLGYQDASLLPYLFFNGGYKPLYFGQHYGAAYLALLGPGNWDESRFIVSAIGNLSDKTWTLRGSASAPLRTWVDIEIYGQYYGGEQGELHFGYEIPAGFVGTEAVEITPSVVAVGVNASVNF